MSMFLAALYAATLGAQAAQPPAPRWEYKVVQLGDRTAAVGPTCYCKRPKR